MADRDEYEEELERQLEALDKQADDVSRALNDGEEPESKPKPELDDADVDNPAEEVDEKPSKPDSKEEASDTTKTSPDPSEDQLTVPIARLSEVAREKRKTEKALRESQDKIAELTEKLDALAAQAERKGVELDDATTGFSEKDFESLSDEFGEVHARMLINMQKQLDSVSSLAKQAATPAQTEDDALMDAIVENDDAHGWFLAKGKNWEAMKKTWADNESTLYRDFKTDAERIEHVVSLIKGKPAAVPPKEKGPQRSLSNVPGDAGTSGDLVDQYLAMGDRAVAAIEKLEFSDPIAYEAVLEGMRTRRLKK